MQTKTTSLSAFSLSVLLSLLFMSESLSGQALKDRIVQAVDRSQTTVLKGNVHPLARAQYDQGRVAPSMPMRVTIMLNMSAAQQTDLNALLAGQQERGSPDYQRWLTPEQYGSRFGLSQGDINKVTGWLQSEGFQIENIPASQNMIIVRGSAQQVDAALQTEIHRYAINGETHFANSSSPSVPAALANVILGIRGLNNFALKPRLVRKISPKFTSGVTGNHFITPPDFATIYQLNSLYQQGIDGTGQKIAVVGQSDINPSDWANFRSNSSNCSGSGCMQLSTNPNLLQTVVVPSDADPGMVPSDIDEASLDVEWAGAIAPNATVVFIVGNLANGGGVFDALIYAIAPPSGVSIPAPVISMSYGECEASAIADGNYSGFFQPITQQANAEGITVFGPGGDGGAADCDSGNVSVNGLAVDMPGSLPTVTSVGGTEFQEGTDPSGIYWAATFCTGLPGCPDIVNSAFMYIPEGAWNDTDIKINGSSIGLTAGGGGASSVVPKPAWQAGMGVPNDAARDVPDVSFSASPLQDPYLICSEYVDPTSKQLTPWCTTNGFRNTNSNAMFNGQLDTVGGTSVGPPAMAGILALISQKANRTTGWGNINPRLYPLATQAPLAFQDVFIGNNQVPFNSACGAVTSIGFNAARGYDLATGLGSVNALVMANNWTGVSPASTGPASTTADFSLGFSPNSLTVKRGACLTGSVQLTQMNGFVGTPTFTCTASASIGGDLAVPTLCTVTQGIGVSLDPPGEYRFPGWWGTAGVLLAAIALILATSRRRKTGAIESRAWPRLVPIFALTTLLAIAIGCGSSSSKSSGGGSSVVNYALSISVPSNAPVAMGSVTVVGAIGALTHTAEMTVTTQ